MKAVVFAFDGINNTLDPESHPIDPQGVVAQCADLVNFSLDPPNITVREGYALSSPVDAATSSMWSNGNLIYCVTNGRLCSYNGTLITIQTITVGGVEAYITLDSPVSWATVNDYIMFSDGSLTGMIGPTGDITIVTDDAKWTAVLEPVQWTNAGEQNTWYAAHDDGIADPVNIIDGGTWE